MTKQEFIEKLRAALTGRVPSALVTDNVNYYEEYIDAETGKGRSEEEVLASLGDPRLIAKTIIQTSGRSGNADQSAEYQRNAYRGTAYQESTYQDTAYRNKDYQNMDYGSRHHGLAIPGWLAVILMLILVVVVVSVLFSVLSFLMPVILVMAAVLFMVKLFRDWLN